MNTLDDEALLNSYEDAVNLQLDQEFIQILLDEINRRKLELKVLL